jgi:hypothetical protein
MLNYYLNSVDKLANENNRPPHHEQPAAILLIYDFRPGAIMREVMQQNIYVVGLCDSTL